MLNAEVDIELEGLRDDIDVNAELDETGHTEGKEFK